MSLSDIWFLYRARLRARAVLVQEGFAIAGIAVGVALLFASQVASTSLTRSVARMTRQIVGDTQYQLQARGPGGFDERLLARVRAVPGVRVALPVLEQQAAVRGPRGQRSIELIGADPRFAHFAGPLLRRFSARQLAAQQALALPAPLAHELGVGSLETVKLQIGAQITPMLVGATLTKEDIGELTHSPVAVAPVRYVQRIAGLRGRITRIFVGFSGEQAAAGHPALTRLAGEADVNLEPANFDATLFSQAARPATQSQTLFSAISALVGFMFSLNAMLMTVPSRRRLVEDVRRQGATRCMTLQILLFDAAVLGVLACVGGLALGEVLSRAAFRGTPGYLSLAFPVGNERVVTSSSVALAMLCGLGAATLGVLWPIRDVIARPFTPGEEAAVVIKRASATRLVVGVTGLVATLAIILGRPASAIVGCVTLFVSLMCLLPALFDGAVHAFGRVQRLFARTSTMLAVTELRAPQARIRSLAIAATGAIALFGVVAIHGAQTNLTRGLDATTTGLDAGADVWILPGGGADTFLTVPFRGINTKRLAHVPGVASVGVYRGGFLNWDERRLWVRALPAATREPIPAGQLVAGQSVDVERRLREGGWVVMSRTVAAAHGLRVGDSFTLPGPHPIRLSLAGLITNLGWSPGALIMNTADYARAWQSTDPSAYEIQMTSGADRAVVLNHLDRILAGSGLTAETPDVRDRRNEQAAEQGLSRLTEIRALVLMAAVLAVTGAMAAMIWQRRDLVAFVKCQGYPRRVLWRWLMWECSVLLAAGCAVGALFGLLGQVLLSHALAKVTGFPIVFDAGALIALSSFALVTVTAVLMVAVTGYLVVRVPPRTISPAY